MLEIAALDNSHTIVSACVHGQISLSDIDYARETLASDYSSIVGLRLLLDLRDFKGWDSSRSFFEHIGLVLKQTRNISRVALVSDKFYIQDIGHLIKLFNHFEIKHFDANEYVEANTWIRDDIRNSIDIIKINTNDKSIFEVNLIGTVRREDYVDILRPQIDDYLVNNNELFILADLSKYESFELGVLFEDFKLWFKNSKVNMKIAIVGQTERFSTLLSLINKLDQFEYQFFNIENKKEALEWLSRSI
jgi:hypothetical protein